MSRTEREIRELLENASPRTVDFTAKLLRHLTGQQLAAAELDELRAVIDKHGFSRADFNLA